MSDQTTIELESLLPSATLERLQAEAERQQSALSDVVREAIEDYLDSLDEVTIEVPTEEGSSLIMPGSEYIIWSPYDSFEAAQVMLDMLKSGKPDTDEPA